MPDNILLICVVSFLGACVLAVVGKEIYDYVKNHKKFDITEFVSAYKDILVNMIKEAVTMLQQNENSGMYPDRESYEKAVIELTIHNIWENYEDIFDTDFDIFKILTPAQLSEIIYDIMHSESAADIFSALIPSTILSHQELHDESVVIDAIERQEHGEDEAFVTDGE